MSLRELLKYIQSTYPPPEKFPDESQQAHPGDAPTPNLKAGLPQNLEPTPRPPLPAWLQPGEGTVQVQRGGELTVGEAGLQPPAAPPGSIDALSYYLPFHFYRKGWGIYLLESGILSLSSMLAGPGTLTKESLILAHDMLLEHQMFHFASEVACSHGEIASHKSLYQSYFLDRHAASLEEGLGNARAFRLVLRSQSASLKGTVEIWMRSQGPGYSDFRHWLTLSSFSRGCRLASNYMLCRIAGRKGMEPTEFLYTSASRLAPPIYVVHDASVIDILKPFPKYLGMRLLLHSRDHPPPHMHVQIPPGRDFTRLQWPSLSPLKGDLDLSHNHRQALDSYLALYGEQIAAGVRAVYRSAV